MYNLPTEVNEDIDKEHIKEILKHDKKMETNNITNIVLLYEIGKCDIHKLSLDKLV